MGTPVNTRRWIKFLTQNKAKNSDILILSNFLHSAIRLKGGRYKVPAEHFYLSNMDDSQLDLCIDMLEKIRQEFYLKPIKENKGILSIPPIPISMKSGIIDGLSEIPIKEIIEEVDLYLGKVRFPTPKSKRINIVFDVRGISVYGNENLKYPVRGGMKKIVTILLEDGPVSLSTLSKKFSSNKSTYNLKRDISVINKNFKTKLAQTYDLIPEPGSNGYFINRQDFNIFINQGFDKK